MCLPGPAGENPSLCILTAPAWAQPGCPCSSLCKASHLHLQPQPLLLRPCPGAQLLHGGSSSGHWLAQGAKGLFYLLWSLGSAAKQGFLERSAPSDLAAMLGHCPAPPQPGGEVTSLSIRMSLGDALLPTRIGTDLWAWTRRHPSSFCSPCMSWWHSELSPPATGTCVYTSPAYLTSGPSGCAPSARGVWAVAAVETAQSTAGSQAQAPSLAPQGSAVSSRDRSCSSCASPAFPTATAVTLCHLR